MRMLLRSTASVLLAGCLACCFGEVAQAQTNPVRPPDVSAWGLTSYWLQTPAWPAELLAESAMADDADRSELPPLKDFFTVALQLGSEQVIAGLELAPVRSPAFRQFVDRGSGNAAAGQPDEVLAARELSYAGTIPSKPGSRIIVNFVGGMARAVIDMGPNPDGTDSPFWYVQSAREVDAAAERGLYVAFPAWGMQLPAGYRCGGQLTPPDGHQHAGDEEPTPEGPTCNRLADIALDADFTFYTANGSSTTSTQADIDSIMNGMRLIYARDTNVLFNISATIIRTTNTLYTSTSINTLLDNLRSEWLTNQTSVVRDLTHLLTGQPTGGTIGLAYVNVVCGSFAYGVSNTRFSTNLASRVGVVAHEVGHNFNGVHCDGDSDCFIMCSGIGGCSGNVTRFGSRSITAIKAHAASRSCMVNTGPFATAIAPRATDDSATAGTAPIFIDVLANDTDANCDGVTISSFSTTSTRGGTITRSVGTGPGGRDRLIYTPVAGNALTDTFTYTAADAALSSVAMVRVVSTQTRSPDAAGRTRAGLDVKYYAVGSLPALPNFSALTPYLTSTANDINLPSTNGVFSDSGRADNVAAVYTGFISVPVAAQYTFFTESDDGSQLFIGTDLVVDNNGLHGMQERSGSIGLRAGTHAIRVTFFEAGGGAGLIARWSSNGGIAKAVIPAANFLRPAVGCSVADVSGGGDLGNLPDGTVDGSDFIAFINSFGIGNAAVDAIADIAGGGPNADQPDGTIDGTDFIAFINAFAIGC